ncbi:hypothetical protein [Streptomyces malaysiensis]|uniref:Uncharacterized protein n=1 Tax=Streptomyces malaysiensis subsp. samsunensis TaxID=459658 RepID=A0A9X2LT24_STRMQ|nr:hypothetical protein [Streptomyces samsunensis]MCQ8829850.1 hypothetical protein [Streptomyces samsunensis]
MDQAVAALCGAGIGVVGTVGASVLTYIGTRRQVPEQGRIEHARQLRIERREVYLAFMELLEPVDRLPSEPVSLSSEYAALAAQVELIPPRGESLLARIQLCGPKEIADSAGSLLSSAGDMIRLFLNSSQDQDAIDRAFESFMAAQGEFIDKARRVMVEPPS